MCAKVLELYSGIGGMHCAWSESGLLGDICAAVEINTVANEVYQHNFPGTHLLNRNIQSLAVKELQSYDFNVILMSPPCQPFTRNGKYLDDSDARTDSFLYLISILDKLDSIEFILMENVKGFECSTVRNLFIDKLRELNFEYQEFLLCPSSVGVPNSRLRYYCIARRSSSMWGFKRKDGIMHELPQKYEEPYALKEILETNVPENYLVKDNLLKRGNLFDICYKDSRRSCCITKAYSHYVEGTGSVFTDVNPEVVDTCFKEANKYVAGSNEFVLCLKQLKLRLFTPTEVLRLMAFPNYYTFPDNITTKQCYRLLGNSVNVKVISELLKILFN